MQKIAFIGAGVMGKEMIKNFLKNNVEVYFYTRTKEKALDLIDLGAIYCDSVIECISNSKIIITMLGFPKDVRDVYLADNGIIKNAQEESYLIDMTTTDPDLTLEISNEAKKRGLHFLDAPVSGSNIKAKDASLTIMVGANRADFDKCYPIFECIGKTIIHEGPVSFGQHTKMANQIAISANISGVCEALYYANKVGLDENKTLITISSGAAASFQMDNMAPEILDEDFEAGFFVKHFVKDMKIALKEAKENGANLPILENVLKNYEELESKGYGDLGIQALYKFYEDDDN